MNEVWKSLIYQGICYPNFEVSNNGNLRNANTQKVYKQHVNKCGYCQVCVSLGSKNKKKVFKMHKAVAETFIPNTENKPQVNHIDGNKINNNIDNLEWVTNSENIRHAYNNGLNIPYKCEDKWNSKLTNEQVEHIRNIYIPNDSEFGGRALARKFVLHHSTIQSILNNKTYVDIT